MIDIKTKEEIKLMKKACKVVSDTLCHLEKFIKPGVETIELDNHPWFVGCQFHPELKSRLDKAHPLFYGFVNASLKKSKK